MRNIGIKAMLFVAAILSLASCSKHFDINKKGGVRIVAEVSQKDVVKALSGDSQDPTFLEAMELAAMRQEESEIDFVTLFGDAFKEAAQKQGNPDARLAPIFLYEFKDKDIDIYSPNDKVLDILRQECDNVAERSYEIITSRLDRYCKKEGSFFNKIKYNIVQQHETPNLIIIELPADERIDWDRVRKLVDGTAQLEFWETYNAYEVQQYLVDADAKLAQMHNAEEPAAEIGTKNVAEENTEIAKTEVSEKNADSTATNDDLLKELTEDNDEIEYVEENHPVLSGTHTATICDSELPYTFQSEAEWTKAHPLLTKLQMINSNGACVGLAQREDIADINKMLAEVQEMNIFPRQLKLAWTAHPHTVTDENGDNIEVYDLVVLKMSRDNRCALGGEVITDARQEYGQNDRPEVTIQMNPEGAHRWKRLTCDNIGRQIAIVIDDLVYSYPFVNGEITNGRVSISGGIITIEAAQDLANTLKTGKLPTPIRILEETLVEPNK